MSRVVIAALLARALVACGDDDRGRDRIAAAPDACEGVADGVSATWRRVLSRPPLSTDRTRHAADQDLASAAAFGLVHHCREDAWTAAMIACLHRADNIEPCKPQLTADQLAKVSRDVPPMMYPVPIMPETTPAR